MLYEVLENQPNRHIVVWDPTTNASDLVADRLFSPNRIVLVEDRLLIDSTTQNEILELNVITKK